MSVPAVGKKASSVRAVPKKATWANVHTEKKRAADKSDSGDKTNNGVELVTT